VTVYGRDDAATRSEERDPRVESKVTKGLETKSLSTLSYGLTAVLDCLVHKPDVALVMNVANGFWLPLLRLRGIPSLVNVDGIEWERAKWGRLAKTVFRTGARLTARWGTKLVCDAVEIVRRWKVGFGVEGVFIPYGADRFSGGAVEEGLRHRGYVLMVARFVPENTIEEFLDAAAEVAATHDVVIVGSSGYGGPLDERVAALAESSERVRWLGHVNDDDRLFSLWEHAGAYFHGHSVGGTNPALVQAMMCGAPTIARDTVYNREVLADAGVFVAPRAREIAAALVALLDDSARQSDLSAAVRARAEGHYTWESVCASYERELRALVRS
jgi:glycosyltransferase involved in cell wall biosynthesis